MKISTIYFLMGIFFLIIIIITNRYHLVFIPLYFLVITILQIIREIKMEEKQKNEKTKNESI